MEKSDKIYIYNLVITNTSWKSMRITSKEELSEDEIESITYLGEAAIPERFEIEDLDEGGEYPKSVDINQTLEVDIHQVLQDGSLQVL